MDIIMALSRIAILVIDVQRYYTELTSPLVTFTETLYPGGTDYLQRRLDTVVLPNIKRILAAARNSDVPIIYARLCGMRDDRSDLHRNFREFDQSAYEQAGTHVYPLATEPLAGIDLRVAPLPGDTIIDKTSYSAFHATGLHQKLHSMDIRQLVITGLTTSQCVNSTARAASDYGYITHMVGDAQADYELSDHNAALYASEPITGRAVSTTDLLSLLTTHTERS